MIWSADSRLHVALRRPLVCIETPDPTATMSRLGAVVNGDPVIQWDLIRGVRPRNEAGKAILRELRVDGSTITSPTEFLTFLVQGGESGAGVPAKTVAFMLNAHRYIKDDAPDVAQAMWNLRDPFKSNTRMLVPLAPSFVLPAELQGDVLLLDEPLPKPDELERIVLDVYTAAKVTAPEPLTLERAVDALRGLAAFPAEQATAMSMTKNGVDLQELWERKRKQIEKIPGLSIWRGETDTLENYAGAENAVTFFTRLLDSSNGRPKLIVLWDEVEKNTKSAGGELDGGTQTEMIGTVLSHMEDNKATGSILLGVPGAGKTQLIKALGNYAGIPVIMLSWGAIKGGIQGQSMAQLNQVLKIIQAFSDGKALWLATSNNVAGMPPELRSRFRLPTFFFDKPTDKERAAIWPIYLREFNIPEQARPDDTDWTGREIRSCCENAWRLSCPLVEAATYVVPVAVAAKRQIDQLRREADGCYVSASKPGYFSFDGDAPEGDRKRQLEIVQ